jgi:hypothetical protein
MAQFLELTQLINKDGMTQVQVGSRRVEPGLDAQWLATLELRDQLGLDQEFIRTALDQRQLFFNRLHISPVNGSFQRAPTIQDQGPITKFCPALIGESGRDTRLGLPQAGFGYILYSYFIFIMSFIFSNSSFSKSNHL